MPDTRPTWKGSLKFSLITIPVRLYPATRADADVSFHQFHRKCHTAIHLKKWCPKCDVEVSSDDIVKGHETSKGRVVFVEDEEVKNLRPALSHTMTISDVMDASTIDPRFIERVYYVTPDSKEAGSPFAVLREALKGKAAIGRLALHGRENLVAIVADETAMVAYALRTAGEVRPRSSVEGLQFGEARVKPEEVRLARQVLGGFETGADLSTFTDNYETALRALLAKKTEVRVEDADEAEAPAGGVVNLMEALRQSLAAAKTGARKPATVKHARPRVLKHTSTKTRRAG